jgi:hypothetical protein
MASLQEFDRSTLLRQPSSSGCRRRTPSTWLMFTFTVGSLFLSLLTENSLAEAALVNGNPLIRGNPVEGTTARQRRQQNDQNGDNQNIGVEHTPVVSVLEEISAVSLTFSVAFPDDEYSAVTLETRGNAAQQGVLEAVVQVLCESVRVVHGSANVCDLLEPQARFFQSNYDVSSLDADPNVIVTTVSSANMSWSTWDVTYTVQDLGQDMFNMIPPEKSDNAFLVALEMLQEGIQLALDISIMEEAFNMLLRDSVETRAVASPIGQEETIFASLPESSSISISDFTPRMWNGLRFGGVAILSLTFLGYAALVYLSANRRKNILLQLAHQRKMDHIVLQTPDGVDALLAQSAQFSMPPHLQSQPAIGDSNDSEGEDDEEEDNDSFRLPSHLRLPSPPPTPSRSSPRDVGSKVVYSQRTLTPPSIAALSSPALGWTHFANNIFESDIDEP